MTTWIHITSSQFSILFPTKIVTIYDTATTTLSMSAANLEGRVENTDGAGSPTWLAASGLRSSSDFLTLKTITTLL